MQKALRVYVRGLRTAALHRLASERQGGRLVSSSSLRTTAAEIEVELNEKYRISPEIAAALRSAPGGGGRRAGLGPVEIHFASRKTRGRCRNFSEAAISLILHLCVRQQRSSSGRVCGRKPFPARDSVWLDSCDKHRNEEPGCAATTSKRIGTLYTGVTRDLRRRLAIFTVYEAR